MNKEKIEEFAGKSVRVTMIDGNVFEGLLWFVEFTDEREMEVASISLDTYGFRFLIEHIKDIELIKEQKKQTSK